MSANLTVALVVWVISVIAGFRIGRQKGRVGAGLTLTILLGLLGLIILAFIPPTRAVKAQRQYGIQAAGGWNAGYPYTSQQPYPPQGPYPQQQPGQWQQPPPPGSWDQPPPSQWPGQQQ